MVLSPNILSERRKFTIGCTANSGVEIEDGNGKKGGNFRGKGGTELRWKNATGQAVCYLRFTLVPDDDTQQPTEPGWPFSGEAPPDRLLPVAQGSWTTCTLTTVAATESYEYVVLGADKTPLLDPVIIIDPN